MDNALKEIIVTLVEMEVAKLVDTHTTSGLDKYLRFQEILLHNLEVPLTKGQFQLVLRLTNLLSKDTQVVS